MGLAADFMGLILLFPFVVFECYDVLPKLMYVGHAGYLLLAMFHNLWFLFLRPHLRPISDVGFHGYWAIGYSNGP